MLVSMKTLLQRSRLSLDDLADLAAPLVPASDGASEAVAAGRPFGRVVASMEADR
jgi:hypothetical protein